MIHFLAIIKSASPLRCRLYRRYRQRQGRSNRTG